MPKMNDKIKIYIGLAIFLLLVLFPVWKQMELGRSEQRPEIVIQTANIPGSDRCVMPAEYMRASHMNLLKEWRETVVRTGDRNYASPGGRAFQRSLTGTCMNCHANKTEFCDRCHAYLAVQPDCWNCHTAPHEGSR
jgi:hypothetical protein